MPRSTDVWWCPFDLQKDDVEVLELDVRQPPSFFEELDPQPKKRAVWKACQDFTGGQVSMGK